MPKKDGKIRICGGHSESVSGSGSLPTPRPEDLFATRKHFTTLDLSHAYNQLPLQKDSRKYVTVNTHKGLVCSNTHAFCSESHLHQQYFKRRWTVFCKVLICYLDDILITGATTEEHALDQTGDLKRLQEHGIRLRKEKWNDSVEYLGQRIDAEGLHATESKLQAITEAPAPCNLQELRSFLGLLMDVSSPISHLFCTLFTHYFDRTPNGSGPQTVRSRFKLQRLSCLPVASSLIMIPLYPSGW